MAVEKETQLEAWLEENMPEPSGGNPNYVETIEGTLANPWGEKNPSTLYDAMEQGDITLSLSINVPGIDLTLPCVIVGDKLTFPVASNQPTSFLAGVVEYDNFDVSEKVYQIVKDDLTTMDITAGFPLQTPVILTIINHPLPET